MKKPDCETTMDMFYKAISSGKTDDFLTVEYIDHLMYCTSCLKKILFFLEKIKPDRNLENIIKKLLLMEKAEELLPEIAELPDKEAKKKYPEILNLIENSPNLKEKYLLLRRMVNEEPGGLPDNILKMGKNKKNSGYWKRVSNDI